MDKGRDTSTAKQTLITAERAVTASSSLPLSCSSSSFQGYIKVAELTMTRQLNN